MKIYSRKELTENNELILKSIRKVLYPINEVTTLQNTSTPDFKEGMVVYFTNLNSNKLKQIEEKLKSSAENQKVLNLPDPGDKKFYGDKSFESVLIAIKHLSNDKIVLQNDIRLFANALSIARLIQSIYGKPVQADRGILFTEIRKKAVELVSKTYSNFPKYPDKWCPADIYIYNDKNSSQKALNAKDVASGYDSLNEQFQSDLKNTSKKILGISLKEQVSQGGAGGSFEKILTRNENYKSLPKTSYYSLSRILSNYAKSKKNENNSASVGYISTAHANAKNMIDIFITKRGMKVKGLKQVESDLEETLKLTLGKIKSKSDGKYESSYVQEIFDTKGVKKIKYAPNLEKNIQILIKDTKEESIKEYNKNRDIFLKSLKDLNIKNIKIPKPRPASVLSPSVMLSKSGCYKTAGHIIDNLNSEKLGIPESFRNIFKQKNPFVAWTAYAIGMAGISPTFFKMIGNSTVGSVAKVEPFYGNGYLHLDDKEEATITDSETGSYITIDFITKVTMNESEKSKTVHRYKCSLMFDANGDRVTVKVSKIEEV
jgi:hypothetical protein